MKLLKYIITLSLLLTIITCGDDSAFNPPEERNNRNDSDDTTLVTTPTDSTTETQPSDITDTNKPTDTTAVTTPNDTTEVEDPSDTSTTWRFVVLGDTHVTIDSDTVSEMIPYFFEDSIDLILLCGDIVEGGRNTTAQELKAELLVWESIFQPLYDAGIGVYPVRGNHEDDANDNIFIWNKVFTGDKLLPQNGPAGEENLTYSFKHKNALFLGLDTYVDIHKINQPWLEQQLDSNSKPHIFPFGHEAAFKVFHDDCLDDFIDERDTFWKSLTDAGTRTYFCGHDHFLDITEIEDGDGNANNNIFQYLVGSGGGWLMDQYGYNGENSTYTLNTMFHEEDHGYALVEVSGDSDTDLSVTITWKQRVAVGTTVQYIESPYVVTYEVLAK